jgi:hypothetical protein
LSGDLGASRNVTNQIIIFPNPSYNGASESQFTCEVYWRNTVVPPPIIGTVRMISGTAQQREFLAEAETGIGGTATDDERYVLGPPAPLAFDNSFTQTDGEYELWLDVEEWVDILTLDELDPAAVDADGFPYEPLESVINAGRFEGDYGSAYKDGVAGRYCRFYEMAQVGGEIGASITNGRPAPYTATATITDTIVTSWEVDRLAVWTLANQTTQDTGTRTGTVVTQFEYGGFSAPFYQTTGAAPSEVTNTANGDTLTVECIAGPGATSTGSLTLIAEPDTEYKMQGLTRAWNGGYPSTLNAWYFSELYAGGPDITLGTLSLNNSPLTVTQRRYSIGSTVNGVLQSGIGANEKTPVRVWIKPSALTNAGEDVRDWRLMILGRSFNSFDIEQDATVTVYDGSSATGWAAGANTSVSASGGVLDVAISGGTGSATWSPSQITSEGYRYLRLRLRSTVGNNQPLTVGIAGETWDAQTGNAGTYVDVDIDLCCSDSETDDIEEKDSRFPIEDPGGNPDATDPQDQYKLGWGVEFINSIALTGLADGETYQIDYIQLVRDNPPTFRLLAPFAKFGAGWTSPSDTTTLTPYLFLRCDGRESDWPHLAYVNAYSGSPYYRWFSITELISFANYVTGWTATAAGAFPDSYHTNALEALHAGAGGMTYNYSSGLWSHWVEVDTTGTVTVKAQAMYDAIEAYPGAGKGVWTGDAYDDLNPEIPLAFGKVFRARSEGLVFTDASEPYDAADITQYETVGLASTGTATTDVNGIYATGSPYARGNRDITTELHQGAGPYLTANRVLVNRERDRTSFRQAESTAEEPNGYAVSRDSRHARAYMRDGTLRLGFSQNNAVAFTEVDTGITDVESVALAWTWQGKNAVLYVTTAESGTVKAYRLDNEAGGLTLAITIGSGTHGCTDIGADGVIRTYRLDSGTVYVRAYDAELNPLYAEQTTNLTGLDDAEIDVRHSVAPDGKQRVGLLHFVGGSIVLKFSADGISFS